MRLLPRFKQLITANAHVVVDRLEDPQTMLRQAVREMEASLDEATGAAAQAIAGEKLLARRAEQHRHQAEALAAEAQRDVAAGKESAAREALRRRQGDLRLASVLAEEHAAAARANAALAAQLAQLHAELREARARLLLLESRQSATNARRRLLSAAPKVTGYAVHRQRFDAFAERVEFAEAETDALAELAQAADILNLRQDRYQADEAAIEAELVALRAKLAGMVEKSAV